MSSVFTPDLRFRDELKEILIKDEGRRRVAYADTRGNLTIGVGHKLSSPLSEMAIEQILDDDLSIALVAARAVYADSWERLPRPVKQALTLMAFQMGKAGLAQFELMKTYLDCGEWDAAAKAAQDSAWAKQTPSRADRVAGMIRGAADAGSGD